MKGSMRPVTQEMFTIRDMYFLQDCRPIKDQFVEYQETLLQRGYSLLMDPVTYMAAMVSGQRGLEPLSMYRFGATAMNDSPFVKEMSNQQSSERLKELIEENEAQLKTDMLGTVIMELDTMSGRIFAYMAEAGKKDHLFSATFPDTGSDKLMGHFPEGTPFVFGVRGSYYPDLRGYLENTNLHLYPVNSRRYSKADLEGRVTESHARSISRDRKGVPRDFPDMRISFRGNSATKAHDSIDGKIKAIHGVEGVKYFPLLVEYVDFKTDTRFPEFRQMLAALYDTGFAGDDGVFVEAAEARKRGEVYTLRDLGVVNKESDGINRRVLLGMVALQHAGIVHEVGIMRTPWLSSHGHGNPFSLQK